MVPLQEDNQRSTESILLRDLSFQLLSNQYFVSSKRCLQRHARSSMDGIVNGGSVSALSKRDGRHSRIQLGLIKAALLFSVVSTFYRHYGYGLMCIWDTKRLRPKAECCPRIRSVHSGSRSIPI